MTKFSVSKLQRNKEYFTKRALPSNCRCSLKKKKKISSQESRNHHCISSHTRKIREKKTVCLKKCGYEGYQELEKEFKDINSKKFKQINTEIYRELGILCRDKRDLFTATSGKYYGVKKCCLKEYIYSNGQSNKNCLYGIIPCDQCYSKIDTIKNKSLREQGLKDFYKEVSKRRHSRIPLGNTFTLVQRLFANEKFYQRKTKLYLNWFLFNPLFKESIDFSLRMKLRFMKQIQKSEMRFEDILLDDHLVQLRINSQDHHLTTSKKTYSFIKKILLELLESYMRFNMDEDEIIEVLPL